MTDIYILGGAQSDFSRNWTREGLSMYDLFADSVQNALSECRLQGKDIGVGHVGNFVGELFTGQGMLGGWFGHADSGLAGMPASRHEGACASGSLAILAAMADIRSGNYETAIVTGIELMRNVNGKQASENLGAAAWVGREATDCDFVWPAIFSDLAEEYERRYGLDYAHLGAIAKNNFGNAKRNPNAQTLNWQLNDDNFSQNDATNPVVEGWMRRHDCSQISDGAATIILASAKRARDYARQHGIDLSSIPRIKGWGHTTAPMLMQTKLDQSRDQDYVFPWVRKAITDAYTRAGISGHEQLDAIEVHDCFTITEYMIIEHFGITAPGEGYKAVEDGRIAMGGSIPVNPSGGLLGLGHPVGATGVRMALDCWRQTTGNAGDMQVEGASTVATYNVGGSATTSVSLVIGV